MTEQGSYAQMPPEQQAPAPTGGPAGAPPSTIRNAVYLMYARVVLAVLSIIVTFTAKDSIRSAIEKSNGQNGKTLTPSQIDTAVTAGIAFAVVIGIVFLVLYVLLAVFLGRGKKWAWITALVISGLGILSLLGSFTQAGSGLTHTVSIIAGLVDLAIFVLLLLTPSRAYFARRTA